MNKNLNRRLQFLRALLVVGSLSFLYPLSVMSLDDDWFEACDEHGPPPNPECVLCELICLEGTAPVEEVCPPGTVENAFGICVAYDADWPDINDGVPGREDECRNGYIRVGGRCVLEDPIGLDIDCGPGTKPVLDIDDNSWHCDPISACEECDRVAEECSAQIGTYSSSCLTLQEERARARCSPDIRGINPGRTWNDEPVVEGPGANCVYTATPNTEFGGILAYYRCEGSRIDSCINSWAESHPGSTKGARVDMNAGLEIGGDSFKVKFGGGGQIRTSESWGGRKGYVAACGDLLDELTNQGCLGPLTECKHRNNCSQLSSVHVTRLTTKDPDGRIHISPYRSDQSKWSGWQRVPGDLTIESILGAAFFDRKVYLFSKRYFDGALVYSTIDNGEWSEWIAIKKRATEGFAAITHDGYLYLFNISETGDSLEYNVRSEIGRWLGWRKTNLPLKLRPAVALSGVSYNGVLQIFLVPTPTGDIYTAPFTEEGSREWEKVAGALVTRLAVRPLVANGELMLFGVDSKDGEIYLNRSEDGHWEGWKKASGGPRTGVAVGGLVAGEDVAVIATSKSDDIYLRTSSLMPGERTSRLWGVWNRMPGAGKIDGTVASVNDNRGRSLFFKKGGSGYAYQNVLQRRTPDWTTIRADQGGVQLPSINVLGR